MSLVDRLTSLLPQDSLEPLENNQMAMADELEKTLEDMGIQLQPRFDIPLENRTGFMKGPLFGQNHAEDDLSG